MALQDSSTVVADHSHHLLDQVTSLPADRKPRHVAVIMDGNGRWAAQRGLPRLAGHEAGTENIRRITKAVVQSGIPYLTLWAFSTENWRRPAGEVDGLMRILGQVIEREIDELDANDVRLCHIGSLEGLPVNLQQAVNAAIARTADNPGLVLTLAFNYGSRQEITHAVRQIVAAGLSEAEISDEVVGNFLYTGDLPDPDLIVRTSGELRMSNFLLWQAAFAELYFTPVYWPDFDADDFLEAVLEYSRRDRRFGATSDVGDVSHHGSTA